MKLLPIFTMMVLLSAPDLIFAGLFSSKKDKKYGKYLIQSNKGDIASRFNIIGNNILFRIDRKKMLQSDDKDIPITFKLIKKSLRKFEEEFGVTVEGDDRMIFVTAKKGEDPAKYLGILSKIEIKP